MTTILIVIVFLVVGFAAIAALYEMNKKPADKCKDHSDKCGCDSGGKGGGGAPTGSTHAGGDSSGHGGGGGDSSSGD